MADAYEVVNLICVKIKLDKNLFQKLETTPRMVRVVLDDDEKKQITDYNVKDWLNALKDARASKLEDIVDRLESVLKLKESLDLKEIAMEHVSWKAPSTSLEDGSHIYVKLMLEENNDGEEVYVIPT
ncbi:hypothetical protein D0Y65_006440 [Glycine soja]|uniref:Disease resistance N-terminal domain-containing protein n=1 Tax=Glycine soja TaxID=3848 RepID=A0A445L8L9_GLYSO|nr:hypothetical protein D0Y65_006440 [Glycine soja]